MAKLGIDLGTSNSAAAILLNVNDTPVIIEPIDGTVYADMVFPSYVAYDKQGEFSVAGLGARDRYYSGQSELVVRHFKRLIGQPFDLVSNEISKGNRGYSEFRDRIEKAEDGYILLKIGSKKISVNEITGQLLRKIVEDTHHELEKRGEQIEALTVSFPAGFEDSQRSATVEAAKLAGLTDIDIKVIEEPTAAAIAKGLGEAKGNIMVIDVGAGTTDVVIGYMDKTDDGLQLIITARACDEVLGGIDMDNLILDYIKENDEKTPRLIDIEPNLNITQRLRLMSKIEDAKINASLDGNGVVSTTLPTSPPKRINVPISADDLSRITAPIIYGHLEDGYPKGVKHVIEEALLNLAGGIQSNVPRSIQQIDWLILIGGPCRMACMREMIGEMFATNESIVKQLNEIDMFDRFFMEGVAEGTALSGAKGISVTTTVPKTISLLSYYGTTPVIAAGTPYSRESGVTGTAELRMHEGSNRVSVISHKETQPLHKWSIRDHIINVPEEGDLTVTLTWGEGGIEADKAMVSGCGLPEPISFPQISNVSILATQLEEGFKWYLGFAKDLRRHLGIAHEYWMRIMLHRIPDPKERKKWVDNWLDMTEDELQSCEIIDPEKEYQLHDDEIGMVLEKGRRDMMESIISNRGLWSEHTNEVINRVYMIYMMPTDVDTLSIEAEKLLSTGSDCPACSSFSNQLSQWLERLHADPNNPSIASAAATALGALADCLHDNRHISEEEFYEIQDVYWRFRV